MQLKVGARLRSQVGTTEVVVIRTAAADVDVRCGGEPMVPLGGGAPGAAGAEALPVVAGEEEAAQLGKRYTDEAGTLELLVSKGGGPGRLSVAGVPLALKDAKPLPASD